MNQPQKTLLTFPCLFKLKVITKRPMLDTLCELLAKQTELDKNNITHNLSKNGKYIAYTIELVADSQIHLDTIYRLCHHHDDVVYVL